MAKKKPTSRKSFIRVKTVDELEYLIDPNIDGQVLVDIINTCFFMLLLNRNEQEVLSEENFSAIFTMAAERMDSEQDPQARQLIVVAAIRLMASRLFSLNHIRITKSVFKTGYIMMSHDYKKSGAEMPTDRSILVHTILTRYILKDWGDLYTFLANIVQIAAQDGHQTIFGDDIFQLAVSLAKSR